MSVLENLRKKGFAFEPKAAKTIIEKTRERREVSVQIENVFTTSKENFLDDWGIKKPPKIKPPQAIPTIDFEVVCINNTGIEHLFNLEVSYVAELHDDKDLYWVYDKLGEKQSVLTERFERV
jgi:hypothetical protein